MTDREVMQQALEALKSAAIFVDSFRGQKAAQDAITALRTALAMHQVSEFAQAQEQAEPVAWAVQGCSKMWRGEFAEIDSKAEAKRIGGTCVAYALYTTQPQQQAEPVAWGMTQKDGLILDVICPEEHQRYEGEYTIPLYTTPTQRKPLTHEQRLDLLTAFEKHKKDWNAESVLIDMIEAAHNIKEQP